MMLNVKENNTIKNLNCGPFLDFDRYQKYCDSQICQPKN